MEYKIKHIQGLAEIINDMGKTISPMPNIATVDTAPPAGMTIYVVGKNSNICTWFKFGTSGEIDLSTKTTTFTTSARDATNPFKVIIYYDLNVADFGMYEGLPAASPATPSLYDWQIDIGVQEVPAVGAGAISDPVLPPSKITEDGIELSDVTTLNVSSTQHGLVPKATGATDYYLRADGTWAQIPSPLIPKSAIALAADFPTSAAVQLGWTYWITADVTDNNPAKTNTGLSFLNGDEIFWNGSTWINIGRVLFTRTGTTISPVTANDSFSIGTGDYTGGSLTLSKRLLTKQGVNVACASSLTLGTDGNTFVITGGTSTLNLINNSGWQNGISITLQFAESKTITNAASSSGTNRSIYTHTGSNYVTSINEIVILSHIDNSWYITGTSSTTTVGTLTGYLKASSGVVTADNPSITNLSSLKSYHGVVARPVGASNPLPTNLTTPVFTLGATANPISYYYLGTLVAVTSDKVAVLDDATGATTTSGTLTSGKYYVITNYVAGDNFTNIATVVSGTTNTTGCIFLTTGTTPTTWTNGSSVRQLVNSQGMYYVYFNTTLGTISVTKTHPGISGTVNVIIANVSWNGTDYGLVGDERHGYTRDRDWHEWAHDTIGVRWQSGVTLTHNSGTGAGATFATTAGSVHDEDIDFVVNASSSFPTANAARLWYQVSASVYNFVNTTSTVPFYKGANNRPNVVNSTGYVLTEVPSASNRYVNFFVYVTSDLHTPIYIVTETVTNTISGQGGYTSVANARAIPFPNLSGLNVSPELKAIYRLIVRADGVLQAIDTTQDDYRNVSSLPQAAGNASTTASAVSFSPVGTVSSTTVQTAIEELDTEKVPTSRNITINSTTYDLSADRTWTIATSSLWTQTTGTFTATPASTSTLTMTSDLTATIKVGFGLKYKISSVYYYGIVTAITSNLLTLAGASMGGDVTELYYCDARNTEQLHLHIAGRFDGAGNDTTALVTQNDQYINWAKPKAYCVKCDALNKVTDTGATKAKVTPMINSAAVLTTNSNAGLLLTSSATWYSSVIDINTSNYDINYGETIDINVTASTNKLAESLNMILTFVYE